MRPFIPTLCPNSACVYHKTTGASFIKKGHFYIKRTNQYVRRHQCKHCLKVFSFRTFQIDYKHKKKDLNPILAKLLVEGNSIRGSSRLLKMTYKNTYKKFLWLKRFIEHKKQISNFTAKEVQFDEMETIHHTKCKPLSIALAVNEKYQILRAKVAEMPAKGRLYDISVKKYGHRHDDRENAMTEMFKHLKQEALIQPVLIKSDAKPSYRKFVKEYFPESHYEQYSRAQKERHRDRLHEKLSKKSYDPMFAINHCCARLRSQIKRLTRRSWCTTKKIENLQLHLDLFIVMQA